MKKSSQERRTRGIHLKRDNLRTFEVGQQVFLKCVPSNPTSGMNPRYRGVKGTIRGTRGSCYEVFVAGTRGVGYKTMIVRPAEMIP